MEEHDWSVGRGWRRRAQASGLLCTAIVLAAGIALASATGTSRAEESDAPDPGSLSARAVLEDLTAQVLAVIDAARAYVDEDPQRYYDAVHEVLDPFVDYRGFARGIMGEYATGARYRSLDQAGRAALREQLDRFSETIRIGLIRTYSKGLLAFGGSRVELDDSDGGGAGARRAALRQLIYSDAAQPYVMIYQMARDKQGVWRLRNLVVENINLGQIYRSQFEAAARRFNGDLDAVIDNWSTQAARDA